MIRYGGAAGNRGRSSRFSNRPAFVLVGCGSSPIGDPSPAASHDRNPDWSRGIGTASVVRQNDVMEQQSGRLWAWIGFAFGAANGFVMGLGFAVLGDDDGDFDWDATLWMPYVLAIVWGAIFAGLGVSAASFVNNRRDLKRSDASVGPPDSTCGGLL